MPHTNGKKGIMALKIDLHKVYDSLRSNFLEQTLVEFGFPDPIRRLIMFCVSSSFLSILQNGVHLDNFSPN